MPQAYKPLPSLEELQALLRYEAETGHLYWRGTRPGTRPDLPAGTLRQRGYIDIGINGVQYAAHRIAWAMATGEDPGDLSVDHIDRNRSNNALSNLRLATFQQQQVNRRKPNKYGLKGVTYKERYKLPWIARIKQGDKQVTLGHFATKEEAHAAYCAAATKLHGVFSSEAPSLAVA